MSSPTDALTEDQIAALWRAGFTIVRRQNDPFEIDPKLIPRGMAYQWNDAGRDNPGWREVPYSRHPGVFAPWGAQGTVEIGNLYLCDRPKVEVDAALQGAKVRAQQQVDDWATKAAALGITGSVRTATQTELGKLDTVEERQIGSAPGLEPLTDKVEIPATRTIETTVGIPKDMVPHMQAIFKERDRLEAGVVRKDRTLAPGEIADNFYAAIEADKGAPWWPTLRAILLPIAVDNVRANLKKEETDD